MNLAEALEAMEKRWKVQLTRTHRLTETYIGILKDDLQNGEFWFDGESGNKRLMTRVKPGEISLVRKEE